MKNKVNIHQALKVFHKIIEHGTKKNTEYVLNDIIASSDFDGYTVSLRDENVTLTIFFHHKYDLIYKTRFDEDAFFDKLSKIDKLIIK
ncbi:DUF3081 family protein [Aliikangiella sp. IMCC44359]|uniref:DUF3081 family protein n=1 Tax=Aliikangiella sp. IMCC44359 TaxID=3459125 RepID=UPI00403A87AA